MQDDAVPQITVIISFVLYEFLCTTFEMKNAVQPFQCLMNTVCIGLDFVFAYLDHYLITSQNSELHKKHLVTDFCRLKSYDLVIEQPSAILARQKLTSWDMESQVPALHPYQPDKVTAILSFPSPYPATHKGSAPIFGHGKFLLSLRLLWSKRDESSRQWTVERGLKKMGCIG